MQKTPQQRALGVLGMALGAGVAIAGNNKICDKFKKTPPVLLIIASDASPNEAERVINRFKNVPLLRCFSIEQLSQALGSFPVVFVALRQHGLSAVLLKIAPEL